jgi:adenosylmethionine-8-amino-7-oxononanoate aminotransferase
LLIADEVMTGLGRVGANFGLDHWDVQPDIIALGKGLSAGYMPLGAVIASGKIAAAFERGSGIFEHGFTYSGHPVACAAGVAALDYLHGNQLVERVSQMEGRLLNGLRQLANDCEMIGDVRGRGFLCAMEFVSNRETKQPLPPEIRIGQAVARAAMANGLIVYPGAGCVDGTLGDHIMIAPPFVMSESEIDELLERLAKSLKQSAVSGTDLAGLRRTN